MRIGAVVLVIALGAGCGDPQTSSNATPAQDASIPRSPDASTPTMPVADGGSQGPDVGDTGAAGPSCSIVGEKVCTGWASRRACGSAHTWTEETCGSGQGCVAGDCVASACSDECTLGATNGAKACSLYDISSGTWTATQPDMRLHDRARAYQDWLVNRGGLAYGGVVTTHFSDPGTYAHVDAVNGVGDSAIWTGTYLAAEALRLKATGAVDARAHVRSLVDTLHLFFNVAGDPGMLARYVWPTGTQPPYVNDEMVCTRYHMHCGVTYDGKKYDYIGGISRDQYQGVMLGYALAYEALGEADEDKRALIRDDVLELVNELMREKMVPIKLIYSATLPPALTSIKARFVVLNTAEMTDGRVVLDTASNPTDPNMSGIQEFSPNLQDLLGQIIPMPFPFYRASSAIMLASFFRVALRVSEGIPARKAEHDAIHDYYLQHSGPGGNINDWLKVAKTWIANGNCGQGYFGYNITMEPMYNLARLEDDPARLGILRNDVLTQLMWPVFSPTKNSFFSFIYASNVTAPAASVTTIARDQLAQFPSPPRVHVSIDLRSSPKYPVHDSNCAEQVSHTTAVDVGDREVGDFIWQRQPWALFDPWGDPGQVQPGIDYLIAYWMGRRHAFIQDDAPATCLRWK